MLNGALLAACALAFFAAVLVGESSLSAPAAVAALLGVGDPAAEVILWQIRAPRAAAALMVGGALGLSGAALQGLLRNPLADPGVLGVSATSALAATAALYYGLAFAGPFTAPIAAILGALAATGGLALIAARTASILTLILIGAGVSSLAGALTTLLLSFAPNPFSLADLMNWMMGSVANRSAEDLALAAAFLAPGAALTLWAGAGLSVLALGEEAAAGAGLEIARTRLLTVAGTGLCVGAAVGLAGAVGFVGLAAPHMARGFVDHDPGRTLIPAALIGALLLAIADLAVRLAPTSSELKLGVLAALFGAPAFIWIAARRTSSDG